MADYAAQLNLSIGIREAGSLIRATLKRTSAFSLNEILMYVLSIRGFCRPN